MARPLLSARAMEQLIPQDLAKLSIAQLEQLLEAVTKRALRVHFQQEELQ